MLTLLVLARSVHFAATISLAGIFAWECLVATPVFAGTGLAAAATARLHRRLAWLAWASLGLALVSGAAWFVAVAAQMSGQPWGGPAVWSIVLTRTQFGIDWGLRLGLAVLLGGCLAAWQRPSLGRARALGWAGLVLAALLLATLAWAGHAAATPGLEGDLHLAADILHLLGAGVWLGGLIPFVLLLAAARRAGDPAWAAAARRATRRFSLLAMGGVAVLLAGGLVNTWFLAGNVPALLGTGYGRLLLAKIALFLAMLTIGAFNLLRLGPQLVDTAAAVGSTAWRAVGLLRRNALGEATVGLAIVAVVGILGALPPGLHTEPEWPLPFRLDPAGLGAWPKVELVILALVVGVAAIAAVAATAVGRYRQAAVSVGVAILAVAAGLPPVRSAAEEAYPTSFYAPTQPYSATSVARGAALYDQNCVMCHGRSGRGDGPAAAALRVRPANLTEPHLLAHNPGDLYWWISHGLGGDDAMPAFAEIMKPNERWDVINFVRARAFGIRTRRVGPEASAAAAPTIPDFAFEAGGEQGTLAQTLKDGPVLLVLFAPPTPTARLVALAAEQPRLAAAGLRLLAVELDKSADAEQREAPLPPFVVDVSADVAATLALFRSSSDGGETELILDRNGAARARWTADGPAGLPGPETLVADAEQVARLAVAGPSHAGHGQ